MRFSDFYFRRDQGRADNIAADVLLLETPLSSFIYQYDQIFGNTKAESDGRSHNGELCRILMKRGQAQKADHLGDLVAFW